MAIFLNDNLQINAGKSSDNKYLKSGLFLYTSTGDAEATILPSYRSRGLTVLIDDGGVATEYWWRDGTANGQLIKKSASQNINKDEFTLTSNGTRNIIGDLIYIRIKPTSELSDFKIGTVLNGSEIYPSVTVPAGVWSTFLVTTFYENLTTIYFSGITSSTTIVLLSV